MQRCRSCRVRCRYCGAVVQRRRFMYSGAVVQILRCRQADAEDRAADEVQRCRY